MYTYYDVLELEPTAAAEDIRRAYLRKVLKVHPDRSTEPEAKARFQLLQEAYECLSDPKARARYDQKMAMEDTNENLSDSMTEEALACAFEQSEALWKLSAYLRYMEVLRVQRMVQMQQMSRPMPVIRPLLSPINNFVPMAMMRRWPNRQPIVEWRTRVPWQGVHWMA